MKNLNTKLINKMINEAIKQEMQEIMFYQYAEDEATQFREELNNMIDFNLFDFELIDGCHNTLSDNLREWADLYDTDIDLKLPLYKVEILLEKTDDCYGEINLDRGLRMACAEGLSLMLYDIYTNLSDITATIAVNYMQHVVDFIEYEELEEQLDQLHYELTEKIEELEEKFHLKDEIKGINQDLIKKYTKIANYQTF